MYRWKRLKAQINGKQTFYQGFDWKYRYLRAELRKPVEQICPITGRVLNSFDSIAAAARAVQISPITIRKALRDTNNQTSYRGFLWRMGEKTSQDDDNKL